MTHTHYKKTCIALAIGSALCGASTAIAAENSLSLEEVIVTAQKRAQSLQDVPMAVSALSADQMLDAGVQDMEGVSRQVPVLEVQSSISAATTNFRIRRVGNLGNIPTFEPAVGVFVDGAFRSRAVFGASDLFDIERIEILRGPQSTLYGKNTTAGVIGIHTQAPAESFEWRGELTAGQYDVEDDATLVNFKGGVSGPLTDNLGASLGVSYSSHDEIQVQALEEGGEDANDLDRYSIRGQLQWDATDDLSLRLIMGTVQQDDNNTTAEVTVDDQGGVRQIINTFEAFGVSTACDDNRPHNRVGCSRTAVTTDMESYEATLLADYEFGNGMVLNSITSWDSYESFTQHDDVAQVSAPIAKFHDTHEGESWQQELRVNSVGGETVDWLAGVFLYHSEYQRGDEGKTATFVYDEFSDHPIVGLVHQQAFGTPFPLPMAAQGQSGYLDGQQDTDYIGVFGQATWNITDSFNITGGLRWQEEEKDATLGQWTDDPSPSIFFFNLSPAWIGGDMDRKTDEVTWSLTPQWFVTEDTMLYLTASHGFKSGGFNVGFGTMPMDNREFDDEDIMHLEAGFKTELLDGRMRLAGSVFATDYDDYQDAAFVGAQFTVGNAESAELRGVELEGTWLISEYVTADFAVSYASLEYDEYNSGMCYPGRVPDSPTMAGACDLSGENPVNAPEWKTHLGVAYERPVSWGDYYVRADWSWTDEYNTSFSADPNLVQDAYDWVSVRAGLRWSDYELVAWVDNALDETVSNMDSVVNFYAVDNSVQSWLQKPRSYGLTFRVNY